MIEHATQHCDCPLCRLRRHAEDCQALGHIRNARREMLLAAKSLIECCIEKLDDKSCQTKPSPARKVDIT